MQTKTFPFTQIALILEQPKYAFPFCLFMHRILKPIFMILKEQNY